jgi:hypothetical protein
MAKQPPGDRYRVDDPVMKAKLQEIGGQIGDQLGPGKGFALFLFDFGEGGNLFYISNGTRDDVLTTLSEWIQIEGH